MARPDPNVQAHLEWLGFVQPTGLLVSPTALVRAGVILPRADRETQERLIQTIEERPIHPGADPEPVIVDFKRFTREVLGWALTAKFYAGVGVPGAPVPSELELPLPDYGETLRADLTVREPSPAPGESAWQLLVRVIEPRQDLDRVEPSDGALDTSPHGRIERLLRATGVTAGLVSNGRTLRLISAPRAETSGWIDFRVRDMIQTAGRPIAAALALLLSQPRLLTLPKAERLAALLRDSRRFQNEVSERLSSQVLHALYELLRGFQAADERADRTLLARVLTERPDDVYRGLLTVVLRLVFLLYAEERELLPPDPTFQNAYSLAALHARLREDAGRHPDTMGQRYGAWGQLLALFRMVHDGASAGDLQMPVRHGELFDPDRFPFLEGRPSGHRQTGERIEPPLVPDGTVFRVLEQLLVLEGERLSYRALDVEQIGSVYETMMGFVLQQATGPSVAIRSQGRHGAPTAIDLAQLAAIDPGKRAKWIDERASRKLSPKVTAAVKQAATMPELHAALEPVIDVAATPDIAPVESLLLQPSEERRRSGSHYTPRSLTEPIVRTTLRPLLDRATTPAEILDLKVCDPAMGSGAFLVETCRQLAAALVEAWRRHGERPPVPPDEDELILAMRLVAQRCLYGVDRNPMAVALAKMSLWLATLAREHPLTFLDHALHHGDSLVGLTRRQIESFHWEPGQPGLEAIRIGRHLERVSELRRQIREAGDDTSDVAMRHLWRDTQDELDQVLFMGDLAVAGFFAADKPAAREDLRGMLALAVTNGTAADERWRVEELRERHPPLVPFHWQVVLPEVFDRPRPGFDAIVGNPPFLGGRNVTTVHGQTYSEWLVQLQPGTSGGGDLVAQFFRRAFDLIRADGTLGLIATNTIGQGDTRVSGLGWIALHGGSIFAARKRVKWPSASAAVVVSVVHVAKGEAPMVPTLDGRPAERISSYLFHGGGDEAPARLAANAGKSFIGSYVLGMGFTFDDTDTKGVAASLDDMRRLVDSDPKNSEVIFPYIGGEEVNTSPTHAHHRYVINFGERDEEECRERWPELMAIVEEKVKPDRITKDARKYPRMVYEWWKFWNARPELHAAMRDLDRVLVAVLHQPHWSVAFLPRAVYSHALAVFPIDTHAAFCALQSRPHEVWARFFGSSLEDRLRYTPSDCFETFPFPDGWEDDPALDDAGRAYYEHRAALMIQNDEGLTKTYNRFHDPYEKDDGIVRVRELHAEMDRAVLAAYGWDDIPTDCEFILDYEIDEAEFVKRRKPYRYRWPDEVRDEVLARLIELNAERAAEERRSGAAARPKAGGGRKRKTAVGAQADDLF